MLDRPTALWTALSIATGRAFGAMQGSESRVLGFVIVAFLALGLLAQRRCSGRWVMGVLISGAAAAALPAAKPPTVVPVESTVEVVVVGFSGIARRGTEIRERVDVELLRLREGRRGLRWSRQRPLRARLTLLPGPPVAPGDVLRLRARIDEFAEPANPTDFNPRLFAIARGYEIRMFARSVHVHRAHGAPFIARIAAQRRRIAEVFDARLSSSTAGVGKALVLGDRTSIDRDQVRRWSRAGIAHLLAISGLHVSLVAAAVLAMFRALRFVLPVDPRVEIGAAALAATLFCLWTGSPVSALRATTMVLIYAASRLCYHRQQPTQVLGLCLATILLLDAGAIYDLGLWLSVVAVASLMAAPQNLLFGLLAPWLGTLPLSAWGFGVVGAAGPVANALAIPLATFLVLPASLLGAGGVVCELPKVARVLLTFVDQMILWIDQIARVLSGFGATEGARPALWAAVAATLMLLGALGARSFRLALYGLVVLAAGYASEVSGERLEVRFLAVGQGDATLLRFPDQGLWLIDGGGTLGGGHGDGPGRRHVVPAVLDWGQRLEVVVATHTDADHIQGLVEVARAVPIGELWWHGAIAPSRLMAELIEVVRRAGGRVREASAIPMRLEKAGVSVSVFNREADAAKENDRSLVLRVSYLGTSLLLSGDIEADTELRLAGELPRSTIATAPHHGSRTSSSAPWREAVAPELVVISCGRNNRFGFPSPDVLDAYADQGIAWLRLDLDGQVHLVVDGDGYLVVSGQRARRQASPISFLVEPAMQAETKRDRHEHGPRKPEKSELQAPREPPPLGARGEPNRTSGDRLRSRGCPGIVDRVWVSPAVTRASSAGSDAAVVSVRYGEDG